MEIFSKLPKLFSSMTLCTKWPQKLVNFSGTEPYLPLLHPTLEFKKVLFKSCLICVKNAKKSQEKGNQARRLDP